MKKIIPKTIKILDEEKKTISDNNFEDMALNYAGYIYELNIEDIKNIENGKAIILNIEGEYTVILKKE